MTTISLLLSFLVTFAPRDAPLAQKTSIVLPKDNAMAQLKPGPGRDAVKNKCGICHSTDYIVRQPRLDAKQWESEVKKMKAVFGAPVSEVDAKEILDYLVRNYGSDSKEKPGKK